MMTFRAIFAAGAMLMWHAAAVRAQGTPDLRLTLSKAGALPEVPTRTNVAFDATITNTTGVQASNVLTRVTMPAGFTNLSTSPQPGSGITCTIAGTVVSCTAPTMPGNSEKRFRITSTAPAAITGQTQTFTLTAVVDPNNTIPEGGAGNSNNSDDLGVTVATRADLTVNLTGAPGVDFTTQLAPNLAYVVTVRNSGDRAAANLLTRATLPKDVEFVRVEENRLGTCLQNSTASNGALNVNCTLSSLAAGASAHVRIIGRVLGSVPDKVQVTFAAAADPQNTVPERNDTDNTGFVVTTLRAPSDLQVTAGTVSKRRVTVPDEVCFVVFICNPENDLTILEVRFTVRNNGPYAAASAPLGVTWTAGVASLASLCPTGTTLDPQLGDCVEGRGATCFSTCTIGALNPTANRTIVLHGAVPVNKASSSVTVTATADPNQTLFESVRGNNSASTIFTAP
jgi:uncharacterized repeat protein (TIGR01451 family)